MSPRSKKTLTMLAIVGPFVLFFVAGRYFIDPWSLPRQNQGELLIPHVQLAELELEDTDGGPYDTEDTDGHWSLLYVAGEHCDDACKNGLYYQMRQVRQTLGEKRERLHRVVVLTEQPDAAFRAFLDGNVAGMEEARGDLNHLKAAMTEVYEEKEQDSPLGDVFVVSPDAQIFLRYPTHHSMDATLEEAENIRLDLERTLKGSLI